MSENKINFLILFVVADFILTLALLCLLTSHVITIEKQPRIIMGNVSMYNAVPEQTDDTPTITASGKTVTSMTAACPDYLEFGTLIKVNGKIWRCDDRMAARYRFRSDMDGAHFDLIAQTETEALEFGRKVQQVEILE